MLSSSSVSFLIYAIMLCNVNTVLCEDHSLTSTDYSKTVQTSDEVKSKGSHPLGKFYGFVHGFVASVSVIIVSELGDKTFFIAAIMAMKYPRMTVFTGALGALGFMTVLSAALGYATTIIPRKFTFYVSTALFVYFGLKMLHEGYKMDPNEGQEEYEEVQAELKKKEEELQETSRTSVVEDPESGIIKVTKQPGHCFGLVSPVFLQSFTLTFLAEWGDRSQLATIILATREDVLGVTLGGTLGHALCTGLAVIGGRLIAQKISVKTVTLIGGVVFLLFAVSSLIIGP
ncbi:transmembrane protein 165-like isoform X2 [Dendronephthya gigantea]|uniref:transmembrane protein 165-like isoform X2 n=1 Tax=Dendronephthya gigantea TaxID=151771 RepID=UPI00106BBDF1|nr:transmembrane protein 165-like isoform X2 [Dendronephthya gigantea]